MPQLIVERFELGCAGGFVRLFAGPVSDGFATAGVAIVLVLRQPQAGSGGRLLADFITQRHLANAAKVLLATSLLVSYGYAAEIFTAFYSGDEYERYMTINRWIGPYAPVYWSMLTCNVLVPQLMWWRALRNKVWLLFVVSIVVNLGMWMERFLIVVSSLHRGFLPSAWGMFYPSKWDWIHLLSSIALFVWLFLMFIRLLPAISIAEMRKLMRESAKEKS